MTKIYMAALKSNFSFIQSFVLLSQIEKLLFDLSTSSLDLMDNVCIKVLTKFWLQKLYENWESYSPIRTRVRPLCWF